MDKELREDLPKILKGFWWTLVAGLAIGLFFASLLLPVKLVSWLLS